MIDIFIRFYLNIIRYVIFSKLSIDKRTRHIDIFSLLYDIFVEFFHEPFNVCQTILRILVEKNERL
jgi:hypothetical protein